MTPAKHPEERGGVINLPLCETNILLPVPSQRLPETFPKIASFAPTEWACANAITFSPYEVVLSPERAPCSFLGNETVITSLKSGWTGAMLLAIITFSSDRPFSDPKGATHPVIVILNLDGKIDEEGTHDELLALKGRYFALFNQQKSSSEPT